MNVYLYMYMKGSTCLLANKRKILEGTIIPKSRQHEEFALDTMMY